MKRNEKLFFIYINKIQLNYPNKKKEKRERKKIIIKNKKKASVVLFICFYIYVFNLFV